MRNQRTPDAAETATTATPATPDAAPVADAAPAKPARKRGAKRAKPAPRINPVSGKPGRGVTEKPPADGTVPAFYGAPLYPDATTEPDDLRRTTSAPGDILPGGHPCPTPDGVSVDPEALAAAVAASSAPAPAGLDTIDAAPVPTHAAPVPPVDTTGFRLPVERYRGASGFLRARSGGKPSPIMHPGKPCNGISDRTRAALLDLVHHIGGAAFTVGNLDAGIIGFLLHLGHVEHIHGTGDLLDKPAPSGRHYIVRGAYRVTAAGLAYAARAGVPAPSEPLPAFPADMLHPDAG